MDRRVYFFAFVLAIAGTANAEDYVTKVPDAYTLREAIIANHYIYLERDYLDELAPPPRIQDKRRIKIRYDRTLELGQTRIILRLKASPKPKSIVQVELRF